MSFNKKSQKRNSKKLELLKKLNTADLNYDICDILQKLFGLYSGKFRGDREIK